MRIVKIGFYFSNNLRYRISKTSTETRVLAAVDYQFLETLADINSRIPDFFYSDSNRLKTGLLWHTSHVSLTITICHVTVKYFTSW